MNSQLINAIDQKNVIEFNYGGHKRVAEPHVYGAHSGKEQLLVFQIGGSSSSGGLPQWRRVNVAAMSGFAVTAETFAGPRSTVSGEHTNWDETYALVR